MEPLTIQETVTALGAALQGGHPEFRYSNVSIDTRTCPAGSLFIGIQGDRFDGHDFVEQAVAAGAEALVVTADWYRTQGASVPEPVAVLTVTDTTRALQDLAAYYRRKFDIPVVAVTGSNGKTTTKNMLAAMAAERFAVLKTKGNLNNFIGVPLTLFNLDRSVEAAVVEMGMSEPGEIEMLTKIAAPGIGVITTAGAAHLDVLKTVENVAKAKMELAVTMEGDGPVLLNADNHYLMDLKDTARVPVKTFGIDAPADIRAGNLEETPAGGFTFTAGSDTVFTTALPGRFNVYNALAAVAAGRELGISDDEMAAGLAGVQPEKMRMQRVEHEGVVWLCDCYNANPASMGAALDVLGTGKGGGKRIAVLGDMFELGDETALLHESIGTLAAGRCDRLITVGETARQYAAGAATAGMDEGLIHRCAGHEEAAGIIKDTVLPGDTVLVKGSRGMKMETIPSLRGVVLENGPLTPSRAGE